MSGALCAARQFLKAMTYKPGNILVTMLFFKARISLIQSIVESQHVRLSRSTVELIDQSGFSIFVMSMLSFWTHVCDPARFYIDVLEYPLWCWVEPLWTLDTFRGTSFT